MGRLVMERCAELGIKAQGADVAEGLTRLNALADKKADAIIDFSRPEALEELLFFAAVNATPTVIATTGHTERQIKLIKRASRDLPIFYSPNVSCGVALLKECARLAAKRLPAADAGITETHRNGKIDRPSGTALMLKSAIERESRRQVEVVSMRLGDVFGVHEIVFASQGEIITLKHEATDRRIFADGAIKAARFIAGKKAGLYESYTE